MWNFIKSWGVFLLIIALILLTRVFVWDTARVDGNSMDPTLANGQRLITLKVGNINRFDIVIAKETLEQSQENNPSATSGTTIVKRVIGMPGDTISYANDVLTINGVKYDETYLSSYEALFANNKLADHYGSLSLSSNLSESQRSFFVQLAKNAKAFTMDNAGNTSFTFTVPQGQYFLLGDDRLVSADSRVVGGFTREQIIGKVFFRIWPLDKLGFF